MMETLQDAEITAVSKPAMSKLDLESIHTAFLPLRESQNAFARRNLEAYLTDVVPGVSLTPTLTTDAEYGEQGRSLSFTCAFHGMMTPEEYEAHKAELKEALAAHSVLSQYHAKISCEHQPDGQVCLQASILGMNADDYVRLIQSLADQQHAHDNFENDTGFRHEDSHTIHEKMKAASTNLKSLVEKELKEKGQEHPPFEVKLDCKKSKKTNKYTIDLRLMGQMDRAQAQPIMGELAKAFRRKRRNGMVFNDTNTVDDAVPVGDRGLQVNDLGHHGLHAVLDNLARPVQQFMGVSGGGN